MVVVLLLLLLLLMLCMVGVHVMIVLLLVLVLLMVMHVALIALIPLVPIVTKLKVRLVLHRIRRHAPGEQQGHSESICRPQMTMAYPGFPSLFTSHGVLPVVIPTTHMTDHTLEPD